MGAVEEGVVAVMVAVVVVVVGVTVCGSEELGDNGVDAVEAVDGCCVRVAAGVGAGVEQAARAIGQASTTTAAG